MYSFNKDFKIFKENNTYDQHIAHLLLSTHINAMFIVNIVCNSSNLR